MTLNIVVLIKQLKFCLESFGAGIASVCDISFAAQNCPGHFEERTKSRDMTSQENLLLSVKASLRQPNCLGPCKTRRVLKIACKTFLRGEQSSTCRKFTQRPPHPLLKRGQKVCPPTESKVHIIYIFTT